MTTPGLAPWLPAIEEKAVEGPGRVLMPAWQVREWLIAERGMPAGITSLMVARVLYPVRRRYRAAVRAGKLDGDRCPDCHYRWGAIGHAKTCLDAVALGRARL